MIATIPDKYKCYVQTEGPFEGFTHDETEPGYVVLWPQIDLAKNNADIEIELLAPGFIAFGGNGGGEVLAFDATGAVFMLPMIGMEPKYATRIANDFQELVTRFEILR